MLMRFDTFNDFERVWEQMAGGRAGRQARSFPMDAYRRGDEFVVHFDLPGVDPETIDLTVDRNILTVQADRRFEQRQGDEILVTERPQGTFTRQLMLGDQLDAERIDAGYDRGVLTLTIPVAELLEAPLGGDREDVAVHRDVDRVGVDAGQVEVHDELVAAPVGVHRERPRLAARLLGRDLLPDAVEVAEGIEAHQHASSCTAPG